MDWKWSRSRLEVDWKWSRSRLEVDWKWTGSGLEVDITVFIYKFSGIPTGAREGVTHRAPAEAGSVPVLKVVGDS